MNAMRWYEERRPGLGGEFLSSVDAAIASARTRPESFPKVRGEVRRVLLKRFPYAIHFLIEPHAIVVLSVFQAKRDPEGRQDRA
jgi:hypothetical protein